MTNKRSPEEKLFDQIQDQLDWQLGRLREIDHNSKGQEYENKVSEVLESYFGSIYEIRTRVAILDSERKCFDTFNFVQGDDEIDLVASFRQSDPRVVFEMGSGNESLQWVPYEGVAFTIEIKSQLDKQALEADLGKLSKIRELDATVENRFGPKIGNDYTINEPLRCLLYDKASISDKTFEDILKPHLEDWHIILLVEEDTIILNTKLPIARKFSPSFEEFGPEELPKLPNQVRESLEKEAGLESDPEIVTVDKGLLWFLASISISIPDPLSVSTINSVLALSEGVSMDTGASTSIGEDADSQSE